MIYSLLCGNCPQQNNVEAFDDPISWTCGNCQNDNSSSLPRSASKQLITDSTKAKALLSDVEAASAKNVVQAVKLSDKEAQAAQEAVDDKAISDEVVAMEVTK